MIKRVAVIGDIHACVAELKQLYNKLCWISLDEIWCIGDIVDRGEHSGQTIDFLINKNIKSIQGNHKASIITHYEKYLKNGSLPRNPDKVKTIKELSPHHLDWMKSLPPLHVIDDLKLILVHGGLWPNIPLYAQPDNVCRAQLIHPDIKHKTSWFGESFDGTLEKDLLKQGWERWYKLYDYEYDCIFGHSSFNQPMIYQQPGYGKCIGIDTGSSFGGSLTACVYTNTNDFFFISVKNKKVYYNNVTRSFWEVD